MCNKRKKNNEFTYKTNLCPGCYSDIKKNVIPLYSIANNHDYGDYRRIEYLEPLTSVEKHLISYNRLYGSILKLKQGDNRKLIGNLITFQHDGPIKCAEEFNLPHILGISEVFQVVFLGSKEEFESKRKDVIMTCGQLQVRTKNIYNWLRTNKSHRER